jgi:RHS repeat-associated protein
VQVTKTPAGSQIPSAALAEILANEDMRTKRGFTDHEQLDEVEIIHMNGRIYDPRLGRFLNADPIVQAPSYSQSYNRYAYTFNSPLSFVDPSGFGAIENLRNLPSSVERWANSGWERLVSGTRENMEPGRGGAEFGGPLDPSGANTPVPQGGSFQSFEEWVVRQPDFLPAYVDYLAEREGLLNRRGLAETLVFGGDSPETFRWILDTQIADLDRAFACTHFDCGIESVAPELYLLGAGGVTRWVLGKAKSATTWANQMAKRGWNDKQITEALSTSGIPARNAVNPGNPATRHVHPTTGQSVVIDNKTNEIIHLGGKDFDYSDWDLL